VAIANGLGATSSSPSMPNRPYASVRSGPCWVHTISGTAGLRRARAVTLGMRESQVTRHAPFRPRPAKQPGGGFKVPPGYRDPPGSCPRGGGHRGRASPAGRAGNHRRQVQATSFSRAVPPTCHQQRNHRYAAVNGAHPRGPLCWTLGTDLTAATARHCMACKRSRRMRRPRC
jgi:hypothetical protein